MSVIRSSRRGSAGVFWLLAAVSLLTASLTPPASAEEGSVVGSLRIAGNRHRSGRRLGKLMNTQPAPWYGFLPFVHPRPFDAGLMAEDVRRIESHYRDSGYLNARVTAETSREGKRVSITLRVTEGNLTRLQGLSFEGLDSLAGVAPDRLRRGLSLRAGKAYRQDLRGPDKDLIVSHLQNRGYPYASVSTVVRVQADTGQAWVLFRVSPGPRAVFGEVRVEGNSRVSTRTILRGLDFRPGDIYRESHRGTTQRLLYRSGAFRAVNVRPDLTDSVRTSVPILLSLQERPSNVVRVGGGYDTEEALRGSASWGRRNFLGGARTLTLGGKASRILVEGKADLRQPFVLDGRTDLNLTGFARRLREPGFRGTQVGGGLGLSREFAEQVVGLLQYEQKSVRAGQDTMLINIRASFLRDRRDNIFDPQSGAFLLSSVEQVFVQRSRNFLRLTADARWYRQVTRRMTFAVRAFGGGIRGEIIPTSERFFSGGASSVRGWGLQELGRGSVDAGGGFHPLGGKYKTEGSAELRWRLPRRLGAAVFGDFGNLGDELEAFDFSAFVWSAGFGIRYVSPIGPIRVDFAYKVKDPFGSTRYGLRKYNTHFSLGQAF